MNTETDDRKRFEKLLREDIRYQKEAYCFIYGAFDYACRMKLGYENPMESMEDEELSGIRVSVGDFLEGIRQYGLENFGRLAGTVFNCWGIYNAKDFGNIIYNLVNIKLMELHESDSAEEFKEGYGRRTLEEVFNPDFKINYCHRHKKFGINFTEPEA